MNYAELTDKEREIVNGADIISQCNKTSVPWTVKRLVNAKEKGKARFDNAAQRSEVWNAKQKSLLIDSIIRNDPVPPLYAIKDEDGVFDFLDGKQRATTLYLFLNDQFKLVDVPGLAFEGLDEEVDLNGLTFSELPEKVKDAITSFSLTIYGLEDLTDEQVLDIFARLNNGTSLSQIEMTRVQCKCMVTIKELTELPIFEKACTEKQRQRYNDEDAIIKLFKLFSSNVTETGNWSLDSKDVRPFMREFVPTPEDIDKVKASLSVLEQIYDAIIVYTSEQYEEKTQKFAARVAKKILNKTNIVTLAYFFATHDNVGVYTAANFLLYFFSGSRATSISGDYNANSRSGANHSDKVEERIEILKQYLDRFINNSKIIDDFKKEYLVEVEEKPDDTEAPVEASDTTETANDEDTIPFC